MQRMHLNRIIRHGDQDLNPYFEVRRDKLVDADGEYVGFDALINTDLKKTLSVVGQSYHLVTHKEASDVVHNFLEDVGINFEVKSTQTANNGAQYFERIQFPDYKFQVIPKGKDTSLDRDGHSIDEYIPTIEVGSSYDKTFPTMFKYGAFRLACSNGLQIGGFFERLSIRHNRELVVDLVRGQFKQNLESTIAGLQFALPRLNERSAQVFVEEFILNNELPSRLKKEVLELAGDGITCKYDFTETEQDKRKKPVLTEVSTSLTAYAFLNVLTQVTTHNMKNAAKQQAMFHKIARTFNI